MNSQQIERVRRRAFTLWEVSGKPHGNDLDHWLQAEGEILSLAASPAAPAKARNPRQTLKAAKSLQAPSKSGGKTARAKTGRSRKI